MTLFSGRKSLQRNEEEKKYSAEHLEGKNILPTRLLEI